MKFRSLVSAISLLVLCTQVSARGDWKDDIGYNRLDGEVGVGLETGAGVDVAMSEAWRTITNEEGEEEQVYLPDFDDSQFSGKNLSDASGLGGGVSSHANSVARRFFGNTTSISGGVTNVELYQADHWIAEVAGDNTGADPAIQDYKVKNASWIGNDSDNAAIIEILNRVDFMIDRDDFLMVAGTNNGSSRSVPDLVASGYNALIVGRSDGKHAHGPTTINGAGRGTPHIVAPAGATSFATPMVSSTAALLHEKANGTDAARSETMRAVLMAGASKTEFADWNRTTTRPLDEQFGAGEVNVYNSYQVLEGGQFAGQSTEIALDVGEAGWDYVEQIEESESLYYSFNVDPGFRLDELSISLNWNLEVEDLNPSPNVFDPSTSLGNLDLRFFDSSDELLGSLLDTSQSTVDNLEHLYFPRLEAGTYTLEVMALSGSTDYGLAWSSTLSAVPEPTSWMLLGMVASAVAFRRRRVPDRPIVVRESPSKCMET